MTTKRTLSAKIKSAGYKFHHQLGADVFNTTHCITVTQNGFFVLDCYGKSVFGCLRKILSHTKKRNK